MKQQKNKKNTDDITIVLGEKFEKNKRYITIKALSDKYPQIKKAVELNRVCENDFKQWDEAFSKVVSFLNFTKLRHAVDTEFTLLLKKQK